MAGRLHREEMPVERLVGTGSVQIQAENSVMLSGGDREVTLISVQAVPELKQTEAQTGGVAVQGAVECRVLYLDGEGQLRTRNAQAGFAAVMPVPDAEPGMQVQVMPTVTGAEASERDGKLDLSVQVSLEGLVRSREEVPLPTGLEGDAPMAEQHSALPVLRRTAVAVERRTFSENFPLDDESYTRVVTTEAQARIEQTVPTEGMVTVSGSVLVDNLMAGGENDAPIRWQAESLPFEIDVTDAGFAADQQVSAVARVRDLTSEVVFRQDGEEEEGNLHIEYVLEIVVTAQEEEEHSVVNDAYPLDGEPFRAEQTEIGSITSDETVGQTQIISAEIELPPEIPAMHELIGAFSAPVALETVGDDAAHAEGLMRVTLLYRPQDDPAALASYTQEIPFALDFDRISGLSQISGAQIGRVESEKLAPDRAQVRIPLTLTAEKVETASVPVLADVAFEGEPASLPKGVVLYYPREGESEWEIAKRFRFSQEALQKRNPEGKAPYLIFRRLTGE